MFGDVIAVGIPVTCPETVLKLNPVGNEGEIDQDRVFNPPPAEGVIVTG